MGSCPSGVPGISFLSCCGSNKVVRNPSSLGKIDVRVVNEAYKLVEHAGVELALLLAAGVVHLFAILVRTHLLGFSHASRMLLTWLFFSKHCQWALKVSAQLPISLLIL